LLFLGGLKRGKSVRERAWGGSRRGSSLRKKTVVLLEKMKELQKARVLIRKERGT